MYQTLVGLDHTAEEVSHLAEDQVVCIICHVTRLEESDPRLQRPVKCGQLKRNGPWWKVQFGVARTEVQLVVDSRLRATL